MRILLIEDDTQLGEIIKEWLQLDGYAIDWIRRGNIAEATLRSETYDCLLLDRGLPGVSGDDILRSVRSQHKNMPVIIITAKDALEDKIKGLDLGADDYMVKPFDLEELSARIRAAIRRFTGQTDTILRYGPLSLNPTTKQVFLKETLIKLTAKEYALLHTMMQRPTQIITRSQLENKLYSWGEEVESNAVEVHIHHLRKKLGNSVIQTIRNLGYTLSQEK